MLKIFTRIPIKDNGVQGEIMGKIQVPFKKFIAIAIVLNVAVGMALSVVSLFAEVSKSNSIMVDAAQLWAQTEHQNALEWQLASKPTSDRGALGELTTATASWDALRNQLSASDLWTPALGRDANAYATSTTEVQLLLGRANFRGAGTHLAKITEPQLIALRGDLTDAQQIQLAKSHRTTQVADFETVAMMAFAAILSSMLFRRVSLTRLNAELVVANERARAQARFRSLVNNSSDVLVVMDSELKILFLTPSWEGSLFGSVSDWIGRSFLEVLATQDSFVLLRDIEAATSGQVAISTLRWHGKEGGWRYMESIATNLLNDSDVGAIVLNARDVTDRRELEEKLVHNAFHDTLTNLPNRALFAEHLEGALSRVLGEQQAVVLFVDLDDFKNINDTLGHSAGDAALVLAADRLREVSPIGSTVARLAGDEFAVLMENLSLGFDLQRSVGDMLSQLGQPYVIGGSKLLVSASIGVAASGQGVYDAEELLRNADIAMYVAKKSGKARAAFYDPTMHDDIIDRLRLKADLGAAIERDEFLVLYQPVVALDGGEIVGVEALVRWIHPSRGMIAPLKFIPLAEENDLIVEIGRIVLTKACTQMAVWNLLRGAKQLSLNVNLSVRELIRDDLVDFVKATLDTTGLDPCCLVLEITETMLMAKLSSVAERFGELHALGVRIAIDDFGTGYSSLSYLENLPVDSIKIDKSFVDSLLKGENPVTLRTIIQLGNELKLKLVAEGIEEAMQAKSLIELGCEFGQGFHFARPLPPSEVEQLIFSPVAGSRNQNRVSQRFATEPIQEIVTKVTEGTQK